MKPHHSFSTLRGPLVKGCSAITVVIYLLIAVLLVITALMVCAESVKLLIDALADPTIETMNAVVQSILFIIIIATLIDMVRSYVKYGRILLRPIFIAGITTMVRRLLVGTHIEFMDMVGITLVIVGLSACLIFIMREERKNIECMKDPEKENLLKEDQ
ncbi:MAG TPA: phosphate-starvation-inducible PsiE family protein [Methanocorpusculum sp.]|nr:phosphate-starvation-inducible PsiE family protein [Methanocorpusculum sp.]